MPPLDYMRARRKLDPLNVISSTDYSRTYSPAIYDSLGIKFSGTMSASGTGTNALDGPFGVMGRVEWVLGDEPIIIMHGSDVRHLSAIMCGGYPEILPAAPANNLAFLAQAELPLRKFISNAGIDARSRDLIARGRTGLAAQLGTTVIAISGRLRFSGETVAVPDGVHYQPRFLSQTVDISTQSADLKGRFTIASDYTPICGIYFRQHDASRALADGPDAARADYLVREIRVVCNSGGKEREVSRATWGELKFHNTSKWGISAAAGQISSGVAFMDFHDHEHPETDFNPVFMKGDVITVYVDTLTTPEDEFTALAAANPHALGDLLYFTPITFEPKGDLAEAVIAEAKRTPNHEQRIAEARARHLRLHG